MRKSTRGAPSKVKELLKPANWKKITEYTEYQMPRNAIASLMGVNKDTLLKAMREKGYESFEDFRNQRECLMRFDMKRKIFGEIKSGQASDKIKELYIKEYILPFEEWNQKEEVSEEVKTVYVPINTFSNPQELQQFAENQQANLISRLNQEKADLDSKENKDAE